VRRRYKLLLALLVVIGVPYWWLLLDNRPGSAPPAPLPLAELRRLAAQVPGPLPTEVAIQQVGWRRVPGNLFVAGSGLKRQLLSIQAAELSGPWGSVVIDSGFGPEDAEAFGLEAYQPQNQARIDAAMRRARLIVFTHEHLDHMGGLLRLPDFATLLPKALIPPEQAPGASLAATLPWPKGSAALVKPFHYSGMTAIAPGVVLIRDPGHTPGSQMVFARLADGREVLFTVDTATMTQSWEQVRARSRLIGDLVVHEDRAAVYAWLKAIRALKQADPALIVVPGHEAERLLYGPIGSRRLTWGFPPPPPADQPAKSGVAKPAALR